MKEIKIGMSLLPEDANLLRGVNALHGIKETPGLPLETLQAKARMAGEAQETATVTGRALLLTLADDLSHLPPLTGNLILRLTATEEKNE